MEQTHTTECLAQQAEHAAWVARWPGYCRECGAGGVIGQPSRWDEPSWEEPCECTEQGICPRCGEHGLDPETAEGPCVACGWNYGQGADDCVPAECICPEDW